jgi:hypothetical protein
VNEGDESEPVPGGTLDERSPVSAPQSTDASVHRCDRGDVIDPEHRQALERPRAAFPILILDESLQLEGWQVSQQIRDFACETSRAKNQDRIGRAGT